MPDSGVLPAVRLMGFLDFLKKNRPAPAAPTAELSAPSRPAEPRFGTETLEEAPPQPDAFLSDLAEHHDLADDLFSPASASPVPPVPQPSTSLPRDLFGTSSSTPVDHSAWAPVPVKPAASAPVPAPAPAPVVSPVPAVPASPIQGLPDFSEDDIEALEQFETDLAKTTVIGMDIAPVAQAWQAPSATASPPVAPVTAPAVLEPLPPAPMTRSWTNEPSAPPTAAQVSAVPQTETKEDLGGFLAAADYLTITDALKQSRRAVRKCDDTIRDALQRHELMDAQYARAAADIASIEDRLRSLDAALFGG